VSATLEAPVLKGAQRPRIEVIPDGDEHPRWQEILRFIGDLGIVLDEWQERVLWASLLRRGDQWAAFAVAVCAPRQNGKNGVLEPREIIGPALLGEPLLIHSAHLADTSKEAFRRHEVLIDLNDWYAKIVGHVWRANGHESIEYVNGNRIRFRTRTRGGGRGFSGSPVVFDEAMYLPEVSMGAILPVISAQPDPQIWYMGSAVDQAVHDDGRVFARVRERALAGEDPRLAYFEWSYDAPGPDEVPEGAADDPDVWAASNPAFGVRITEEYLRAERRELDERTFMVERLGVGDWPQVDADAQTVIPMAKWDRLVEDPAAESAVLDDDVCIAFDVRTDRSSASVAVVGRRRDGDFQVEVVEHRRGAEWLAKRLVEMVERNDPVAVMCDGFGPAASLVPELDEAGVRVTTTNSSDMAKACGFFFDKVDSGELRHLGSNELRQSLKGAAQRPLGDAWAWSRRHAAVDIGPLVSGTLALWGFATLAQEGEIRIW
jgi:hypothetical protein